MNEMVRFLFWGSLFGLFYIYAGYPVLSVILAKLFPRPVKKGDVCPPFSVVITVFNEADVIASKIAAVLAADGMEKLDALWVAVDGADADTVFQAKTVQDVRVHVVEFPERRGKPSVLNDVIPMCNTELVVLMDARQIPEKDAFINLLRNFDDSRIGVVSGELRFRSDNLYHADKESIKSYWGYEKVVRRSESKWGSVPGATGAFCGVRKSCFEPIPSETLLDDVAIPFSVMRCGLRCIFEPEAVIWDTPSTNLRIEAMRKRRTIAGNLQLVFLCPWLLNPTVNPAWFQFVSHKLLRLLSPFLLVLVFILNLFLLAENGMMKGVFCGQVVFYILALTGKAGRNICFFGKACSVPYAFVRMNGMVFGALYDLFFRRIDVKWRK